MILYFLNDFVDRAASFFPSGDFHNAISTVMTTAILYLDESSMTTHVEKSGFRWRSIMMNMLV